MGLDKQAGIFFPLKRKRTDPGALTVTVIVVTVPLYTSPVTTGAEVIELSLALVTMMKNTLEAALPTESVVVIVML